MKFELLKQKKKLIIVLVVIVLGVLAYYFLIYQKNKVSTNDPTQAALLESQNLVEKVGKLIELPNEQPQIATVSDASKLPNQPFFAKAQNGDKVLIYNIAQKAILYRPSANKIIDVAPLAIAQPTTAQNQASESAVTVTPTAKPTVKRTPLLTPQVTP